MGIKGETVFLSGEWVITAMSDQLQCLMGHRSKLSSAEEEVCTEGQTLPTKEPVTFDMGDIESLDASGCQLLTAFMKIMEKDGFEPRIASMPASFRELLEKLGYRDTVCIAE